MNRKLSIFGFDGKIIYAVLIRDEVQFNRFFLIKNAVIESSFNWKSGERNYDE